MYNNETWLSWQSFLKNTSEKFYDWQQNSSQNKNNAYKEFMEKKSTQHANIL